MKKTLLALAVATTALTFGAQAAPSAELNRDELKDYTYLTTIKNADGELSTLSKMVLKLETGVGEKTVAELWDETFDDLGDKQKFLTLAILNNTNINENGGENGNGEDGKYASVLDQLINGGNIKLDTEMKEKYNAFMAQEKHIQGDFYEVKKAAKDRGQHIVNNPITAPTPVNGDLFFTEEIPVVCGVQVQQSVGSIAFNSEVIGLSGEQATTVVAYNNGASGLTTLKLATTATNLDVSKISYDFDGLVVKPNESTQIKGGLEGIATKVTALYDASYAEVESGNAYITATIEYSCQ
ncbi:hypothetical protein JCM19241_1276 [Vibrio ishigakensis]|uniref:Uncharacterized protein n=1 Tax=Vibrio ishigakensis TaxID=1481914 RepID=A0A0B8QIF8_9VIBR|nr:hypothetical protein JCM19241_1276 [Vibrio ishigakensis]